LGAEEKRVTRAVDLRLHLNHIGKSYEGNPILKDCSYPFQERGIYALIGPNGCGKSTLLRLCALLENPDQGSITFETDHHSLPLDISLRRRISLVLPDVGVFNTTVSKNVAYGLSLRGFPKGEIRRKVAQALQFVGLENKPGQMARTLSSGETKRLGLARALVLEPEFLFLDEPTASVDQKNTELIEEILLKIKERQQSTVLMSTHDADQTRRLADHVIKIDKGKLRPL
jgi:tungstate transport system ATP-binding protein